MDPFIGYLLHAILLTEIVSINFDNTYARLPERFYAKLNPASLRNPKLIRVNRGFAERLSISGDWLESEEGVAMLSGNEVPEGAEPIAQAYAGHQFGGFVPQLGDGRALLLGEIVDNNGDRFDLQLKGSGRTPFSRQGDGKSALGPVIREFIVSEAMAALGVPTTRALAAVASGENVLRPEGALPGGVFTRIAASHIRVGTFQYYYARNDLEGTRILADYVIARHYPEAADSSNPYGTLISLVAKAQADLIAQWMSFGFIHGVMNTDNMAVSGETIDYGPCAFMDTFHPQCVFSSIDKGARYAWGNQPDIGFWNLTRFAETLLPLLSENDEEATELGEAALSGYPDRFSSQYINRFRAKFGLSSDSPVSVIQGCLDLLASQKVDFTLFFRELTRVASGENVESLARLFSGKEAFEAWFLSWSKAMDKDDGLEKMRSANPILIPRNHRIEQAIQSAYAGDFDLFHRTVDALAAPYVENSEYAEFESPPRPEEVIHETFCGT